MRTPSAGGGFSIVSPDSYNIIDVASVYYTGYKRVIIILCVRVSREKTE